MQYKYYDHMKFSPETFTREYLLGAFELIFGSTACVYCSLSPCIDMLSLTWGKARFLPIQWVLGLLLQE